MHSSVEAAKNSPHSSRKWRLFALALGAAACLVYIYDAATEESPIGKISSKRIHGSVSHDCTNTCAIQDDQERYNGDLLDPQDLLRLVNDQRDQYIDKLKRDYGEEHYHNIFEFTDDTNNNTGTTRTTRGRNNVFRSANKEGPSWNRMKRKLTLKVLLMQMGVEEERTRRSLCRCSKPVRRLQSAATNTTARVKRKQQEELGTANTFSDLDDQLPFYARYVWANGGHR